MPTPQEQALIELRGRVHRLMEDRDRGDEGDHLQHMGAMHTGPDTERRLASFLQQLALLEEGDELGALEVDTERMLEEMPLKERGAAARAGRRILGTGVKPWLLDAIEQRGEGAAEEETAFLGPRTGTPEAEWMHPTYAPVAPTQEEQAEALAILQAAGQGDDESGFLNPTPEHVKRYDELGMLKIDDTPRQPMPEMLPLPVPREIGEMPEMLPPPRLSAPEMLPLPVPQEIGETPDVENFEHLFPEAGPDVEVVETEEGPKVVVVNNASPTTEIEELANAPAALPSGAAPVAAPEGVVPLPPAPDASPTATSEEAAAKGASPELTENLAAATEAVATGTTPLQLRMLDSTVKTSRRGQKVTIPGLAKETGAAPSADRPSTTLPSMSGLTEYQTPQEVKDLQAQALAISLAGLQAGGPESLWDLYSGDHHKRTAGQRTAYVNAARGLFKQAGLTQRTAMEAHKQKQLNVREKYRGAREAFRLKWRSWDKQYELRQKWDEHQLERNLRRDLANMSNDQFMARFAQSDFQHRQRMILGRQGLNAGMRRALFSSMGTSQSDLMKLRAQLRAELRDDKVELAKIGKALAAPMMQTDFLAGEKEELEGMRKLYQGRIGANTTSIKEVTDAWKLENKEWKQYKQTVEAELGVSGGSGGSVKKTRPGWEEYKPGKWRRIKK